MKPGRILMMCTVCSARREVARRAGDPAAAVVMYVPCGKHDGGRVHQPFYEDASFQAIAAEETPE